jgi:hypothetical protein
MLNLRRYALVNVSKIPRVDKNIGVREERDIQMHDFKPNLMLTQYKILNIKNKLKI